MDAQAVATIKPPDTIGRKRKNVKEEEGPLTVRRKLIPESLSKFKTLLSQHKFGIRSVYAAKHSDNHLKKTLPEYLNETFKYPVPCTLVMPDVATKVKIHLRQLQVALDLSPDKILYAFKEDAHSTRMLRDYGKDWDFMERVTTSYGFRLPICRYDVDLV